MIYWSSEWKINKKKKLKKMVSNIYSMAVFNWIFISLVVVVVLIVLDVILENIFIFFFKDDFTSKVFDKKNYESVNAQFCCWQHFLVLVAKYLSSNMSGWIFATMIVKRGQTFGSLISLKHGLWRLPLLKLLTFCWRD